MSNVIKLNEVMRITSLSRSSIYSFSAKGEFPKSISLGPRAVGWLEDEIFDWIDERVHQRTVGRGGKDA